MANFLAALNWLLPFLIAFIASFCYGLVFNAPRHLLLLIGFGGTISWIGVSLWPQNVIVRALLGAILVGLYSIILARWRKHPRTLFTFAGIVPLVPGSTAYRSMLALVEQDYITGMALALDTFFSAGAIAAGLILASLLFNIQQRICQFWSKVW